MDVLSPAFSYENICLYSAQVARHILFCVLHIQIWNHIRVNKRRQSLYFNAFNFNAYDFRDETEFAV